MMKTFIFALVLTIFAAVSVPAFAGEPRLVGSYGDWDAYVFVENGKKVCYMASKPQKAEGNYKKRGDIFALVTHRPAERTKDVFSYIAGYTYKPGSDASVTIDGNRFVLFTQDDTAWAPDAERDEKLAKAIRGGSKMTVNGTSSRGTKTTDSFSLKGSGAAHDRINKECR